MGQGKACYGTLRSHTPVTGNDVTQGEGVVVWGSACCDSVSRAGGKAEEERRK